MRTQETATRNALIAQLAANHPRCKTRPPLTKRIRSAAFITITGRVTPAAHQILMWPFQHDEHHEVRTHAAETIASVMETLIKHLPDEAITEIEDNLSSLLFEGNELAEI